MDSIKTGRLIAECRKHKNMTQQQLADALNITNKTISKWETGQGMPDISILQPLGEILGVSIDELVKGELNVNPPAGPVEKTAGVILEGCEEDPALNFPSHFQNHTQLTREMTWEFSKHTFRIYQKPIRWTSFSFAVITILLTFVYLLLSLYRSKWDFYLVLFAICSVIFLLIFFKGYALRANFNWKNMCSMYGNNPWMDYYFGDENFLVKRPQMSATLQYSQITRILETENLYVLMIGRQGFLLQKDGWKGKDADFIPFLQRKCPQASLTQLKQRGKKTFALLSVVFLVLALFSFLLQMAYLTVGSQFELEYVYDWFFYAVNGCIILFICAGLAFFFHKKKGVQIVVGLVGAALMICNIVAGCMAPTRHSIVSLSPSGEDLLVLKEESSGKTVLYRNRFLIFAQPREQFPYTVTGDPKIQWLANDVCAVTYQSTDQSVHQYVSTYGDRGNGISYYYVLNAIQGQWTLADKNIAGWHLEVNKQGVFIKNGTIVEYYDWDSCVQFGTLAVSLCENGLPKWTIVLDDNSSLDQNDLLEKGSTITLCQVSMEKTAPLTFVRTTTEPSSLENEWKV